MFNIYILYTLEYLHFDERINEFSVSLYQDQCPQIVEPFFQDATLDFSSELAADLKLDYATAVDQIKPEHDIKLQMYSSFYNSDYQPK